MSLNCPRLNIKFTITSIDDNRDNGFIRKFVDNELLAIDSRAIRNFIAKLMPDVDLNIDLVDEATGESFRSSFTIGLDFFWPDSQV